jgi:hypothetical protein
MKPRIFVLITLSLLIRIDQAAVQAIYTPYTITTLAGNGLGSADGTGSDARFHDPQGVAVDSTGTVYVADRYNNTIRKVTPTGVVTTLVGLAGSSGSDDGTGSDARFNQPYGVAVDSTGSVYVADYGNHTIRKVTPVETNWVVTTLAGLAGSSGNANGTNSTARFAYPSGVAVDSAGNVYVADYLNHTIRKVTPVETNWVVTTLAGLAGSNGSADGTNSTARFAWPLGVAVDSTGSVYVTDYNNTIRKVMPVGTNWVVRTVAGLAQLDQSGFPVSGSADGTGSVARFYRPAGVAVDTNGSAYVADSFNHTIRKVTTAGMVTTLAGLAGFDISADGTGSAARFALPYGVAIDNTGNIYVADQASEKIRKGYPENTPAVIITSSTNFGFIGGQFGFKLSGPAGQLVVVEVSTNLVNWLPIWTNTLGPVTNSFSDPQSGSFSQRFYRAVTP